VHNRLGRLDRIYVRAPIYFLTACTAQRRPLLAKQDVHGAFIRFAKQGPAHGVWIGAYVLMPDHLHAFVALDAERVNLSALMKSLKNVLSKELRERGVAPPHWQKGFFDHLLRSQESAGGEMEIRSGKSGARRACGAFERVDISRRNFCAGLSRGAFVMCALAFCSGAL